MTSVTDRWSIKSWTDLEASNDWAEKLASQVEWENVDANAHLAYERFISAYPNSSWLDAPINSLLQGDLSQIVKLAIGLQTERDSDLKAKAAGFTVAQWRAWRELWNVSDDAKVGTVRDLREELTWLQLRPDTSYQLSLPWYDLATEWADDDETELFDAKRAHSEALLTLAVKCEGVPPSCEPNWAAEWLSAEETWRKVRSLKIGARPPGMPGLPAVSTDYLESCIIRGADDAWRAELIGREHKIEADRRASEDAYAETWAQEQERLSPGIRQRWEQEDEEAERLREDETDAQERFEQGDDDELDDDEMDDDQL